MLKYEVTKISILSLPGLKLVCIGIVLPVLFLMETSLFLRSRIHSRHSSHPLLHNVSSFSRFIIQQQTPWKCQDLGRACLSLSGFCRGTELTEIRWSFARKKIPELFKNPISARTNMMSGESSPRRIVVLLDGTWQALSNRTNVALFDDNIEKGKNGDDGVEQIKHYFPGVGASRSIFSSVERLLGGAFGYGLSETITDSFSWLSRTYKPGDEIFVFGFSRGAYSARSLVGLMHKVGGVLKEDRPDLVNEAYDLYRDANSDATSFRERHVVKARVKMIGVWDTVGALGIPVSGLPLVLPGTRDYYRFHNTKLSRIVDEAYQALAIDEYRADFQPALWDATSEMNKEVEQCWFVGDHGNIGGGDQKLTLWKLPYVWMQDKAIAAGLRFRTTLKEGEEWRQAPSDSFSSFLFGLYRIYRLGRRYIRVLGEQVEETIHPSALKRVDIYSKYRPKPLTDVGIPPENKLPRRHVVKD